MPLRPRPTALALSCLAACLLVAAAPACGGDEAAPPAAGGRRGGGQGGTAGGGQGGKAGTSAAGNGGGAIAGGAGASSAGNGGTTSSGAGGATAAGSGGAAAAGSGGAGAAGSGGGPMAGNGGAPVAGNGGAPVAGNGGAGPAGNGGAAPAGNGGSATAGNGGSATAGSGGSATAGGGGAAGQAGSPNFDGCDDPLIQPAGWQGTTKTWLAAFSSPDGTPMATYPNGIGFPVPIGAQRGGYTVIPFTPTAKTVVTITWDTAQANPGQGYGKPRPAESMFIGISRCPGDLRPSDMGKSGNPWLQEGCRRTGGGASLLHRTMGGPSNEFVCRVEPGVIHYLTVAAVNSADGLVIGEHTCSETAPNSALGCDVQARHTAVVE